MKSIRRTVVALVLALLAALVVALPASQPAMAAAPLTNLAHLDWLRRPGDAAGTGRPHDVPDRQRAGARRAVDLRRPARRRARTTGSAAARTDAGRRQLEAGRLQRRRRVPRGGRLPAALAADRLETSKHKAYEMLRGLAYFQTVSGPNAGNVVLWMQPDGTLNPVADPPELPSPSDSRRVLLAGPHDLGARRGLRGLPRLADPATRRSRRSSRDRLDLAVGALAASAAGALRHLPAGRRAAGAGLAGRRRRRRDAPRRCSA